MNETQIFIASLFFITTVVNIFALIKTTAYSEKGIRQSLQLLLIFSTVWALTQGVQILIISEQLSEFVQLIGLMFGILTVPSWLLFVSHITGSNLHTRSDVQVGVLITIILAFIIKLSNPIHGLYFTVETISTPFNGTIFTYNIGHTIMMILSYIAILIGFKAVYNETENLPITKSQLHLVSLALLIPGVVSIISTLDIFPLLGTVSYDPIGVSIFSLTSLFFADTSVTKLYIKRHNSFFDGISDPTIIIDKQSKEIQNMNDSTQVFEITEESIGDPITEYIPNFSLNASTLTIGDRTYSIVQSNYSTQMENDSYAIIFKDITELETHKNQLEIKNIHFENMVEGLSHEVRNGLQIIQGYSKFDPPEEEHIDVIEQTANRLHRVSEDLTALAKIGYTETPDTHIEFTSAMEKIISTNSTDITIEFEGNGQLYITESIFKLLIEKVVIYSQKTNSTTVTVKLTDTELYISNDGDGISGTNPISAFEYGEATPSAELGSILPVVKSIADSHSWELQLLETDEYVSFKLIGVNTVPQTSHTTQHNNSP